MGIRVDAGETPTTRQPALDGAAGEEVLVPYTIALVCFCLVVGLLLAASIAPIAWLPGQLPLLVVLCYLFPLVAVFSRRYQATLDGLAAREYGTRAFVGRVLAFAALLVGLPLLEWSRLHPGADWRNLTFGLPVGVALLAGILSWMRATAIFDRWHVLHMQPWEDGASAAPARTHGFDEQSGGRVNRTRQVWLLWRDFAGWGIVLSLVLFAAAIFDFGGPRPPLVASGALFAGYALTGLLVIGRSALLRLATEWRLDRLTIAGNVGSTWIPTTATLTIGTAALLALVLLAHVLDLVHVVLAWLWSTFLAPILMAVLFFLSNKLAGTSRQQFNSAMNNMGNLGQRPPRLPPAHRVAHGAFPWEGVLAVLGAIVALVLLRAYWQYRKTREPGQPWWRIFPAILAELRRLVRALVAPARALAAGMAVRVGATAGAMEARRRRARKRPADMSARELVAFLYEQALAAAARWGHPRRAGQTPGEYAAELGERLGASRGSFDDLTTSFVEARYSPHEVRPDLLGRAQQSWNALRQIIKNALR